MNDDVQVLRSLYRYLRRHPNAVMRGRAYRLYQRWQEGNAASFICAPNGDVIALPCARAALIAEYRILLLRAGFPVEWLARFDRQESAASQH